MNTNVFGLCEGRASRAQMFKFSTMFNSSTKVQLTTNALLLPNPLLPAGAVN